MNAVEAQKLSKKNDAQVAQRTVDGFLTSRIREEAGRGKYEAFGIPDATHAIDEMIAILRTRGFRAERTQECGIKISWGND